MGGREEKQKRKTFPTYISFPPASFVCSFFPTCLTNSPKGVELCCLVWGFVCMHACMEPKDDNATGFQTETFAILEPKNSRVDFSNLHKTSRSHDFEALNYERVGRVGRDRNGGRDDKYMCKSYFLLAEEVKSYSDVHYV